MTHNKTSDNFPGRWNVKWWKMLGLFQWKSGKD